MALVFLGILYPLLGIEITQWAALGAVIGGLLPDIDSLDSAMGILLFPISRPLKSLGLRHRTYTHSLIAMPVVLSLFVFLPTYRYPDSFPIFLAVPLGYLSHYFADAMTWRGVPLLYPFHANEVYVYPWNRDWRVRTGSGGEFWVFLATAIFAVILVPVAHPGPAVMFKKAVASPSNAVDMYHSLRDEYVVYARIRGIWRDTQKPLEITVPVVGAMGSEELLVYYRGDLYEVGRKPGMGIYPMGVEIIEGRRATIVSKTLYFEWVPVVHILSKIKREARPGNLVVITGEMKVQSGGNVGRMIMKLNKRTEAYPTIMTRGGSLVFFFSPLEKLDHLTGEGIFVYSARLTLREIPLDGH
jgi:inner membrane protein